MMRESEREQETRIHDLVHLTLTLLAVARKTDDGYDG
jgi:hypothetical protein